VSDDTGSAGVRVGRVFCARALGGVDRADLSRLVRQVAGARREAGRAILCWLLVDPSADVPSAEQRAELGRATSALLGYCEALTLIIGGNSLQTSLLRSALRSIVTQGGHTLRVRIVDDFEAAFRSAVEPGAGLVDLEQAARRGGILRSLSSSPPQPEP
jgi:hypothetical protein